MMMMLTDIQPEGSYLIYLLQDGLLTERHVLFDGNKNEPQLPKRGIYGRTNAK